MNTIEATIVSREGNTVIAKIELRAVSGEITIVKHAGGEGVFDADLHDVGDTILIDLRSPHIARPVS